MRILIFFQCCQQQLIYAHTLRLGISFYLVTFALWDIHTDIIVLLFEILRVRRFFLFFVSPVSLNLHLITTVFTVFRAVGICLKSMPHISHLRIITVVPCFYIYFIRCWVQVQA